MSVNLLVGLGVVVTTSVSEKDKTRRKCKSCSWNRRGRTYLICYVSPEPTQNRRNVSIFFYHNAWGLNYEKYFGLIR